MLIRYPGGKKKLNKEILPLLSKFDTKEFRYVEPFFGAGGFFPQIAALEFKEYLLNDYDETISDLWSAVKEIPEDLLTLIEGYVPTPTDFYQFKEDLMHNIANLSRLEIAFRKIVLHQISFSGLGIKAGSPIGGKLQQSKYNVGCRWNQESLVKQIKEINRIFSAIHMTDNLFHNQSFENVLNQCNYNDICYIDPPYFIQGNALYNQSLSIEQHKELVQLLTVANYKWILSYDNCEFVRKSYKDFTVKEINLNYSINNSGESKELIITNF